MIRGKANTVPRPLPLAFFRQPVLTLARELLGQVLVHETAEGRTAGRIVEVEAYGGSDDPASHAGRGPTPRSKIMWEAGGIAYVYFSYGTHCCFNVVAGPQGSPGACLIRAIEPLEGIPLMQRRRDRDAIEALGSGPGKLCQAMGISLAHNGWDLRTSALTIRSGPRAQKVVQAPRVGISRAMDLPWRFCIAGSPFLSRAP